MSVDDRIRYIENDVGELAERIERLERAIYGSNGGDGVLQRLARIEERLSSLSVTVKLALTFSIGTFLGIIVTIAAMVR